MFAGRNISATHVAFASTRVMATCAVVGEGVGTAAAIAVRGGLSPAAVCDDRAAIEAVQQQLLRDDAYIIGRRANGDGDFARTAIITASSFVAGGEPQNVVSGQTRSVHGKVGSPPERAFPGTHRWMSDPAQSLPQTLELSWNEPICPSRVQLIFDTGLHRPLTFSLADAYTGLMQWGRPQPETVADYRLEIDTGRGWTEVAAVVGNYQRRRVHELRDEPIRALRIVATATGGLDHVRVCEVRVE
jgi:hypothetical protein